MFVNLSILHVQKKCLKNEVASNLKQISRLMTVCVLTFEFSENLDYIFSLLQTTKKAPNFK